MKTEHDDPPSKRYGLRPDNGWADQVEREWLAADEAGRAAIETILDHFAAAKPRRENSDWAAAADRAAKSCLIPPLPDVPEPIDEEVENPEEPPIGDPGSPAYADALRAAGLHDASLTNFDTLAGRIGKDRLESTLCRWAIAATRSKPGLLNRCGPNRFLLQPALFWLAHLGSPACADALRQVAKYATDNKTPQSVVAALALASIASVEALGALHLLAEQSSRPAPQARFRRAAEHVQRVTGLTADDAAVRFVPDFGIDGDGSVSATFGTCGVHHRIDCKTGNATMSWRNAEGKPIKSLPAATRRQHAAEVGDFKSRIKSIERMLAAQRDRLDRVVADAEHRQWRFGEWRQRYVDHPLVGLLARRLVWRVDGTSAIIVARSHPPQDVTGRQLAVTDSQEVRPWHPLVAAGGVQEIVAWRERLGSLGIVQPFKQAHREVYLLTDAERATRTYSNRFAAHVIRQHQFRALCRQRGWSAELTGGWDGGGEHSARRVLPAWKLRAEFWTQLAGDAFAPSGAALHLATDQIRFYSDGGQHEPIPLDQVPPMAFSEVMRDIDLFVGVASIGNDPAWQDGGPERRYRDYWHRFSFGELTQTAKTRREVLEKLVPRLKIAPRCSLADKFLVVKGDLRTYKIHLGSGNILMEPNDQYLCIVPDRSSSRRADGEGLFLPFEGDTTLSVILSKAFLLADDRKIKDSTITRQILPTEP